MSDHADESPIQRALRLKKAAQDARPHPAGEDRKGGQRAAAAAASAKSKPWMKR